MEATYTTTENLDELRHIQQGLVEQDGVSWQRVMDALRFLKREADNPNVPQPSTAEQFRHCFKAIEEAMYQTQRVNRYRVRYGEEHWKTQHVLNRGSRIVRKLVRRAGYTMAKHHLQEV